MRTVSLKPPAVRFFWMIPETQIGLQEGMLTQTPGFEDGENFLFVDGDLPYASKK